MSSLIRACILVGGLLAAGSRAGPVAVRSTDIEVLPTIQERLAPMVLGNYSLVTSHENDVLFNIGVTESIDNVSETARLEIECVDCRTWGSALITTAGVTKDESIIGDIISFFENPIDTIINAFDLDVKIEFVDVGGHFEFDLTASDSVSYSFSIYKSETLAGFAVSEDVSVGLVLFVDLVFSLTAEIDLEAGFEFSFPEGAYVTVDPLEGKIVDHGFTGGETDSLPILCTSGSATFKAALRVRLQAGTTVTCFGTGFDFSLGVYADLIEYEAALATTPTCELSITEYLDVNVGAYARAVAEIDYKSFGATPTAVTTLLDVPLPSLCVTRPSGSSLPAFPTTASVSTISTTLSASRTGTAVAISASASPTSTAVAISTSASSSTAVVTYASASSSSTPGGIFFQGSSNSSSPAAPTATATATTTSKPYFSLNATSTITSPASLITSTVWTTTLITVTSCSSTVLYCPASAASEIIITSTAVLYTTVCPFGAVLPTTLPASFTTSSPSTPSAVAVVVSTALVSPLSLTPCSTEIVSTIYVPTFVNPTYTMPTATSFAVAYPNWSNTNTATAVLNTAPAVGKAVAATTYPVVATSSPSRVPTKASNGTVTAVGTAKITPTSVTFTGAAGKEIVPYTFVALAGAALLAVL